MSAILRGLGVILAVFALSMPIWAQEACQQGDVAGIWDLYIAGGQVDGPWTGWDACQVTISRQGTPRGTCIADEGGAIRIVGGTLLVRDNCRISGRLIVENNQGARATLPLPRATLALSR